MIEHPGPPAETFWIDDAETLELLSDPTRLEILELLFVPRSVTELAEAMEVPRTRLYHHVRLLENAGMVRVVSTRRVGAMTERIYQVSALHYRPSPTFLQAVEPKDQARAVAMSILRATEVDFVRAVDEGLASLEQRDGMKSIELTRRLVRLRPDSLHRLIVQLEELVGALEDEEDDPEAIPIAILCLVHPSSRRLT